MVIREVSFSRTVFKIADKRKSRDASRACDPVLEPGVDVEGILVEATEAKVSAFLEYVSRTGY